MLNTSGKMFSRAKEISSLDVFFVSIGLKRRSDRRLEKHNLI
jgi:hypothetical protein